MKRFLRDCVKDHCAILIKCWRDVGCVVESLARRILIIAFDKLFNPEHA